MSHTRRNIFSVVVLVASFAMVFPDGAHAQDVVPESETERANLLDSVTGRGPYKIGRVRERDGVRNGPDYKGATIYYPKDAEPPFAGMVIVPGFRSPESAVAKWGPYLASHGIVTMTIGTNGFSAYPEERADALLDAVASLQAENVREDSPLFGRIDAERIGVGGWSMGGGGAQQAAVQDPELDVVLALCPWKPGHEFKHPVPVMILAAEEDVPAPVSMHSLPHYRKTPEGTPKVLFEVGGAGHFLPYDPENANGDVGRIALLWLKVFLLDDDRYRPLLATRPDSASRYMIDLAEPKEVTEDAEP